MCTAHVLSTLGGKIILRLGSFNGFLMLMLGGLSVGFFFSKNHCLNVSHTGWVGGVEWFDQSSLFNCMGFEGTFEVH